MQVSLINTLTLGNLCEYCLALSHIFLKKIDSLDYIFVTDSIGLPSTTFT